MTFTAPGSWLPEWSGLPDQDTAAQRAVPAYLRAYGPATISSFDAWLTRGRSRKTDLRRWFDSLEQQLVTVEVEGEQRYALARDLDELVASTPSTAVRLLAAFDQYVLGPGTYDPCILAPRRRGLVSRTAGWIAPVVLNGGRVGGVWELEDDRLVVSAFADEAPIDGKQLERECERLAVRLGRELRLSVVTV